MVTDELVSTVRSIVGSEYSDMDVVRALHMAKNDPTAAINIIFDTPNFKSKGILGLQKNQELSRRNSEPVLASPEETGDLDAGKRASETGDRDGEGPSESQNGDVCERSVESSVDEKWWLVGCCELAGLSTCKGRRVKSGDEVIFSFPSKIVSTSPSPGKAFGKGRQALACTEIVRFSTRDSGEVNLVIDCGFNWSVSEFFFTP